MKRIWFDLMIAVSLVFGTGMTMTACSDDNDSSQSEISRIADKVWEFSQSHPDGFTININTMQEPTEGIAVSYAATQGSHSRDKLEFVVQHAMEHDNYVGGWLDTDSGLYYYDSTKVFPEDKLEEAIAFGRENKQQVIYIISSGTSLDLDDSKAEE